MERHCPECDLTSTESRCTQCGGPTYLTKRPGVVDPMIGTILDERWRIDALIGKGGMGVVYKATRLATKATVAIKVIRNDREISSNAVRYFHREARTASALSHPHTVRVFDFGQTQDGDLYLVMEFLDGTSLGQVIRIERPLSVDRIRHIAIAITRALAEAHDKGLVHRDLKPENVMLLSVMGDTDFVKVLDFGVAKFVSSHGAESKITNTGMLVGTPQYMAPEQATGKEALHPSTDMYSLGIILYEMLTGARPFDGDTPLAVLMMHVRDPAPELPADLEIPDCLRDLVRALLSKNPADRPTSSEAMEILHTGSAESLDTRPVAGGALPTTENPSSDSIIVGELLSPARTRLTLHPFVVLAGLVLLLVVGVVMALMLTDHSGSQGSQSSAQPMKASQKQIPQEVRASTPSSGGKTASHESPGTAPSQDVLDDPPPPPAVCPTVDTEPPPPPTPVAKPIAPSAGPTTAKEAVSTAPPEPVEPETASPAEEPPQETSTVRPSTRDDQIQPPEEAPRVQKKSTQKGKPRKPRSSASDSKGEGSQVQPSEPSAPNKGGAAKIDKPETQTYERLQLHELPEDKNVAPTGYERLDL